MPTLLAGDTLHASDITPLGAVTNPWTDFSTAALVSVTAGTYTKGLTTYSARYVQIGTLVHYAFWVTINTGGGFTAGAGTWQILLPVTAHGSLLGVAPVLVYDFGTANLSCIGQIVDTSHINITKDGGAVALDSNGPAGAGWATGDIIIGSMTYEAA